MKNTFCYIHIPFCTSKCKYCRFASFGNIDLLKINLYVEKLIDEINKSSYCINDKTLRSIYFGGGTPSVLNMKQLSSIIDTIKSKYIFYKNIEINIEATPITITKENLDGWIKSGVNRISIGVQSLNAKTLKEIGRGEKGDIIKALECIKEIFFNNSPQSSFNTKGGSRTDEINISVDFIIGLPHVKKGEIKKDIEYILDNYDFINHVSVYMLEEYYEQGEKDSNFQNVVYPNDWKDKGIDEEEYLEEYIEIKEFLKSRGLKSYEISNFSKPGYECIHNRSYWNHSNVLGFGLGAHCFINNVRFSNSEEFLGYYAGETNDFEVLDDYDLFVEKIMFGLRTKGLEKELYDNLNLSKLDEFRDEGLLYMEENILKLTDKGVMFLDYILRELI